MTPIYSQRAEIKSLSLITEFMTLNPVPPSPPRPPAIASLPPQKGDWIEKLFLKNIPVGERKHKYFMG